MADTQYQLIVRKGPKVGKTFLLDTISLTIGRDPVSDVVLNDPEVSRQHTRFSKIETGYQVQDLGSTNGTFVNGERLESEPVDLQPGFTISMGSGVTLIYEAAPSGSDLAATMVDASGLGMSDEALETAVPDPSQLLDDDPHPPDGWEPDPSPPFTPPPPLASAPLVPASSEDEAAKKRRRNTIIAAVAAIIMLCCCGFIAYMWFIGGDLILEAIGAV